MKITWPSSELYDDPELVLIEAAQRLIERTKGAQSVRDVERITRRSKGDLLADESGLDREVVRQILRLQATSEPDELVVTPLPDGRMITAAEVILGHPPLGMKIVWLDGDGLNNQRDNLEFWPVAQPEYPNA
jgi:hypothetical protein